MWYTASERYERDNKSIKGNNYGCNLSIQGWLLCIGVLSELLFALCPPCEERVNGYAPINNSCIWASPQLVALPQGGDSAAAPPGPMPPLYPGAPPQSSFSGLRGKTMKGKHNQLGHFELKFPLNTFNLLKNLICWILFPERPPVPPLWARPLRAWQQQPILLIISCLAGSERLVWCQRGIKQMQLHYPLTPPVPPLSASASLQQPSVCWSSYT